MTSKGWATHISLAKIWFLLISWYVWSFDDLFQTGFELWPQMNFSFLAWKAKWIHQTRVVKPRRCNGARIKWWMASIYCPSGHHNFYSKIFFLIFFLIQTLFLGCPTFSNSFVIFGGGRIKAPTSSLLQSEITKITSSQYTRLGSPDSITMIRSVSYGRSKTVLF